MCLCLIFSFFSLLAILPGNTVGIFHFFTFFSTLPYSRSNSVHFLFFTFLSFSPYFRSKIVCGSLPRFQVSRDIAGPTVCISHFLCFSVILPIVQVITCLCIIFHDFYFSRHNRGSKACISRSSRFSLFLAIFQVLKCVFLIWHFFRCFSPNGRCHSVCVSFSNIFF